MVRELLKIIKDSTSEIDIMDAMDDVCNIGFNIYEYPPPNMKRGCTEFLAGWEETIEKELINRDGNLLIENDLCFKVTRVSENHDNYIKFSRPVLELI